MYKKERLKMNKKTECKKMYKNSKQSYGWIKMEKKFLKNVNLVQNVHKVKKERTILKTAKDAILTIGELLWRDSS